MSDDTPTAKARTPRWPIPVAIAALVLGVAIGSASSGAPAAPQPAPTVTVTAEAEPAPAQTVEVEVPGAISPECALALDRAEEIFIVSHEVMGIMGRVMSEVMPDAVMSAYLQDVAGMDQATLALEEVTRDINAATARVESIDYLTPATACRG